MDPPLQVFHQGRPVFLQRLRSRQPVNFIIFYRNILPRAKV